MKISFPKFPLYRCHYCESENITYQITNTDKCHCFGCYKDFDQANLVADINKNNMSCYATYDTSPAKNNLGVRGLNDVSLNYMIIYLVI